jgi:hypothetical protein
MSLALYVALSRWVRAPGVNEKNRQAEPKPNAQPQPGACGHGEHRGQADQGRRAGRHRLSIQRPPAEGAPGRAD